MSAQSKVVGVYMDDLPTWHIVGVGPGDYQTLCGLDGNDSFASQMGLIEPKRGQKIDCPQCRDIWEGVIALRLRRSNFANGKG